MASNNIYSEITPEIRALAQLSKKASFIEPDLYTEYNVKRGLRDLDGSGVLVGITNISEVNSRRMIDGKMTPIDGELFYRGYNVQEIIRKQDMSNHFGFEECTYLLLFGKLPNAKELEDFKNLLANYRSLPHTFVRDVIMKKSSKDMMNTL
ncbi:MAG: citrate synthase, partial [Lachnospiraceae bacterium]|nr:citrate synthase [Lachnospiraceae bacterium]